MGTKPSSSAPRTASPSITKSTAAQSTSYSASGSPRAHIWQSLTTMATTPSSSTRSSSAPRGVKRGLNGTARTIFVATRGTTCTRISFKDCDLPWSSDGRPSRLRKGLFLDQAVNIYLFTIVVCQLGFSFSNIGMTQHGLFENFDYGYELKMFCGTSCAHVSCFFEKPVNLICFPSFSKHCMVPTWISKA